MMKFSLGVKGNIDNIAKVEINMWVQNCQDPSPVQRSEAGGAGAVEAAVAGASGAAHAAPAAPAALVPGAAQAPGEQLPGGAAPQVAEVAVAGAQIAAPQAAEAHNDAAQALPVTRLFPVQDNSTTSYERRHGAPRLLLW
jgi:hypothetical protein